MLSQEIEKLHARIFERMNRTPQQIASISSQEETHLASLADSPGWEVLKSRIDSMIAELLEPIEFPETVPMDVRGAVNEARWYNLKFIRTLISSVESSKSAKMAEKQVSQDSQEQQGMPEKGA